MERKRLIAIIIIAIVVVGGLGWYYFFGTSSTPPPPAAVLYVDGRLYNSTSITWNLNATPGATFYSLHNASNPTLGNASANALFKYTASFYNVSSSQWMQIYNGTNWLISNPNVTVTMVLTSGTLATLMPSAFSRNVSEQSNYLVYMIYTDLALVIKFQYPGTQPAVDGHTVFTYLGFDGNADGILNPASDQAFNFTNNVDTNASMLKVYTPANGSSWNSTPTNTYSWSGNTSSGTVPVSTASIIITPDRKNVTWTIPYTAIGASKDSYIGVVVQAFGYDFSPTGANQTPAKYYRLACFPPQVPTFGFTVPPTTTPELTVRFYFKVTFSTNAIADTKYTFNFTATSPS